MLISIIVPVLNEEKIIHKQIEQLQLLPLKLIEIIFVDGGSTDNTKDLIKQSGMKLISSLPGRAAQMNMGASESNGSLLLFLHADTILSEPCITKLQKFHLMESDEFWGFFNICFDNPNILFRVLAWAINARAKVTEVASGDQTIFVSRCLFQKESGYKALALMEDVEISRRLRRIVSPNIISQTVLSSARRWEKNGYFKTIFHMWFLQIAFKFGVSDKTIKRWYYGD